MKMKKCILTLLLSLCMVVTFLPTAAFAAVGVAQNEGSGGGTVEPTVTVTATEIELKDDLTTNSDQGYTVETKKVINTWNKNSSVNVLKITNAGSYKLTKNENTKKLWCVEIAAASGTVDLTLSGVNLDVSTTGHTNTDGVPALSISGGCETVITLDSENTLKSGVNCAGLQNGEHKLTIKGDGTLKATGGIRGAGIGGGVNANGGNITIESGTVNATGGLSGAGIGGGYDNQWVDGTYTPTSEAGNGFNITISGGTVTATGSSYAAGIGGGGSGDGYNITISGGNVTAIGGSAPNGGGGTGIGGGLCGSGHDIAISGSDTVVTVKGNGNNADIGGGISWGIIPAGSASNITVSDDVTFKDTDGNTVDKGNLTIGVANDGGVKFLVIRSGKEITYTSKGDMSTIQNGDTVKLLGDVTLDADKSITVSAGKKLTLDLNGFTISQEKSNSNTNHSMITNEGTLTITDSSTSTKGEIKYTYTNENYIIPRENVVSNTITNKGTLTITGGCTITNASGRPAASSRHPYAIDNQSSDNSEAVLTVENAKVNTVRCPAIRLFCNSATSDNTVTIRESTIKGSIECQNPKENNTKVKGSLTIGSGTFPRNDGLGTSVYVFDGVNTKDTTDCSGMICSISDGDFYGTVTFDGTVGNFNGSGDTREPFITGGRFHNGTRKAYAADGKTIIDVPLDTNPSDYVVENGTARIVKRSGDKLENYVYTVLAKDNLTDGVYLTDPSGALASGYYVSSTANDVWTVSRYTHSGGSGGSSYSYCTIQASANANGFISPSGNVKVREGADQTFTITPDNGYVVADVKIDGKSIGAVKTYTFEKVKGSHTIEAVFASEEDVINQAKANEVTKSIQLMARSVKTAKKNVKVRLKMNEESAAAIKELQTLGYTVKYKFYRSEKKSKQYRATLTKSSKVYTNTQGEKGRRYYYKARVMVYDENGTLIAKTALKQCKYATRVWSKKK